jgi:hypothetical protein
MARKNPAAVALGKRSGIRMTVEQRADRARKAGVVGGKARAESLSDDERRDSARKAALARWGKKK